MSKRVLSFALAAFMLVSLVACANSGGGSSASTPAAGGSSVSTPASGGDEGGEGGGNASDAANGRTVIKFWSFYQNIEAEFYEDVVKAYNEQSDEYYVEHEVVSQNDYITTLIPTAYANGEAPDVLFVEPATYAKYVSRGMLADLTPYYTEELIADISPEVLAASTYEGKYMALPMVLDILGLMYDADAFAEAGLEPPKTWDDMYACAEALTTGDRFGITLPVEKSPHTQFLWYPFMWMAGADILSEDGKTCVVDSPEMAECLDFWGSFYKNNLCPSSLQIGVWDIGNIGTGVSAMQIGGSYMISLAETTYADVNIQAIPFPTPEGKPMVTIAGGQRLAINAQSEVKDAAADFIFWLWGSDDIEWINRWVRDTSFSYPARRSVLDANTDLFEKGLRAVYTNEIYDSAVPEPGYDTEIADAIQNMQQNVMFGGMTGAEAAKLCQEEIDAYLATLE